MSDYAAFIRWQYGCEDRGGYGVTHGDTFHRGLRDYNQPYPCPNGLPLDRRNPDEVPAWRQKVEKAKSFIRQHTIDCALTAASKVDLFDANDVADLIAIAKGEKTVDECSFNNGKDGSGGSLSGAHQSRV